MCYAALIDSKTKLSNIISYMFTYSLFTDMSGRQILISSKMFYITRNTHTFQRKKYLYIDKVDKWYMFNRNYKIRINNIKLLLIINISFNVVQGIWVKIEFRWPELYTKKGVLFPEEFYQPRFISSATVWDMVSANERRLQSNV